MLLRHAQLPLLSSLLLCPCDRQTALCTWNLLLTCQIVRGCKQQGSQMTRRCTRQGLRLEAWCTVKLASLHDRRRPGQQLPGRLPLSTSLQACLLLLVAQRVRNLAVQTESLLLLIGCSP